MAHVVRLNLRDNRRVLVAVRNVQPPQAFERISCFAGVKKVFNPDWNDRPNLLWFESEDP